MRPSLAPLRVALASHLASRSAPTGAERSLGLLAQGLVQRGHEVTVLAPGPWCLSEGLEEAGVRVVVVASRPCWLTYWESRSLAAVLWKGVRCALGMQAVGRLVATLTGLAPEVVVVNCLPHLAAAAAARRLGRPWAWYLREILPPGWRRRFFARRLVRSGAAVVAVSQAVRAWVVEEQPAAQVEVVYNGVALPVQVPPPPAARRALGLPEEGVWVGYLGQLAPHKGVHHFLAGVAAAAGEGKDLRALVAGPGTPRQQLQVRRWVAHHLGERGVVLPPQPEVNPLLAACDVVCVSTLTPDPAPRVVLEAMAAGRPVVAPACGGIPELVVDGETGILLASSSAEAFAAAFQGRVGDADWRRQAGGKGRERAEQYFSLERHASSVELRLFQLARSATVRRPGE